WDDAVEQIFRRRDPLWLGELRAFLQARGLDAADQIVRDGSGTAPPAAALARLLLALDPGLEPRVGDMWLTPDGLTAAARAVVDGRDDGARLADIGAARVLRLWRGLPGMEWAASIDERWHDATEAFGGFVARVSNYAGWPSRQTRDRAVATLLLCTLHPDHQRDLAGRLAAEQRTEARRQAWWAELAAEGQRTPAAAVVAVLTADQARLRAHNEVEAAHVAARQRERAEQAARQQRAVPPP